MQKFNELSLNEIILRNVSEAGYESPTPIQAQSIPSLLEGKDLLGIAQTGTGKTAAFTLPILNKLYPRDFSLPAMKPRSLILAPTRELASQINEQIIKYGKDLKLKSAVIFGGVGQAAQVAALRGGLDVLVATPGRLIDLMNQGFCNLSEIQVFVLDEADRMLDMGFIHDIKKVIAKIPEQRQTMLFSATMPKEIIGIASRILKNPVRVEVTPQSTTVERIDQQIIFCQKAHKYQLVRKILDEEKNLELCLVFTRTKHGANKIVDYLAMHKIQSAAIHGNKSQSARERALEDFKAGRIKVLIATDIAARGIDVQGVSHVINYDLPVDAESYVHRIGRTARAGKDGKAISFCDETERDALSRIQKLINLKLPTDSFVGVAEKSVKDSRPERRYRDPRAKPKAKPDQATNSEQREKKPEPRNNNNQRPAQRPRTDKKPETPKKESRVAYKFRNKK